MKLPFSMEDIKEILQTDTGFKNFLNTLPENHRENIRAAISDSSILQNALQYLPESYRDQILRFFNDIIHIPEEAVRLYEQCRFFEARSLLLKTIDLYRYEGKSPFEALEKAVGFTTLRLKALCSGLLGDVEWALGNTMRARDYYEQGLELAKEAGDLDAIVKALHGLGNHYWNLGELEKGLEFCHQALTLINGKEDRWRTRNKILNTLSALYRDIGRWEDAFRFSRQAVDLCIRMKDDRMLPASLNNEACLYLDYGAYDLAMERLEEALDVNEGTGSTQNQALILNNLAMCRLRGAISEQDFHKAASFLERAFSLSRDVGTRSEQALSLENMGFLYQAIGKHDEARKAFMDAVKIYRQMGARGKEANTLTNLAWHLREYMGDIEGASQAGRNSIHIIETIRSGLRKEIHRIRYADKEVDTYQLMIDCLLRLNRPADALEYVERAKSRAMLDFLAGVSTGQNPMGSGQEAFRRAETFLEEMVEIQRNLEAIRVKDELDDGLDEGLPGPGGREPLAQSLLDELLEKERLFEEAFSEIHAMDPEKASLLRVSILPVDQISALVDENTIFLELFQYDNGLWLFLAQHEGPVKAFHVNLTFQEAFDLIEHLFEGLNNSASMDVRSHEFLREVRKPLAQLFDRLMGPLLPDIAPYDRIIISPHLFWHYLPFQALWDREKGGYLCDQFEIGFCPSASVLSYCQKKNRTGRDSGLILSRNPGNLPHLDLEAELLTAPFHPNACLLRGEEAHLQQIHRSGTGYDIIHLACHGEFNPDQPFLASIDIPPSPEEQRSSYLTDLFGLNLQCSLVTLSACESGLNQMTNADELMGLSRGLFCAGASAAMLSLWQVADQATSYLMENFYWHYVKNRQTKTRALQLAMQAVRARTDYGHPYYWAPFVITGDWR